MNPARSILVSISVLACAASLLMAGAAGGATAPAKPNLIVTKVTAPAHMELGSTSTVSVTVKNSGKKVSTATTVKLTLSASAKPGATVLGTATVGAIAVGGSKTVKVSAKVPDNAAMGTKQAVACADSAKRVAESNEADNCRGGSTHVM